jgi:predicted phage-related endonuclease
MKIINVIQGSQEWLDLRAEKFTASEAPAMMNDSKYMSRDQLLHMKATGEVKAVTSFQQSIFDKGHATEAMARPIIEAQIDEDLYPVTGILEGTKLLASFDGLDLLEEVVFEHKLWNETLAANVRSFTLEPHYYWQLEQQLLVSGAEMAIFVTSDGTEDNMEQMNYGSVPERREALIAGWAQFDKDLANYEVKAKVEKVVGTNVTELPALMIELTGQVNSSNLVVYKQNVFEFIQNINTDLQTDQDFADAESIVKFCTKAEKEIEAVKNRALDSTADIKTLFAELDILKEEMRQKRLSLDKTVKLRKTEVKSEITTAANNELCNHVNGLNDQLGGVVSFTVPCNFIVAIKGKRTVDSIRSAANDHLAKCKIEADAIFAKYSTNLATVEELAADYKFLFNDIAQVITQEPDHFRMTIKTRVDDHLADEKLRLDQEREQIRLEEERKANEKVAAKAKAAQAKLDEENERIRKEEQVKAQEVNQQDELKRKISQSKQNLDYADTAQARQSQQRDIDHLVSKLEPEPTIQQSPSMAEQIAQGSPTLSKIKTVREVLTEHNKANGYGVDDECLIETLTESQRVHTDSYIDMHRWYGIQSVVNEIDGVFIMFNDYIITGDGCMGDMDLSHNLDDMAIVHRKERTVIEVYYA